MSAKTGSLLGPMCVTLMLTTAMPAALAEPERAEQLVRNALALEADEQHGAVVYESQCAQCHGPDAHGDAQGLIPALAMQRRAYIIKQLADFIERERIATRMHEIVSREAVGDPQTWADLALYLNRLPPPRRVQTGAGTFLELGEASYEQWCRSCHGADGRGDDDGFVPSVRNQHYEYLLKEMRNLARGHRFNVDSELSRFLNSLERDEMQGIADYLSRMHGPIEDRMRMHDDGTVSD